jgi:guanine nucleotide-binding protein G(i) subunit alpha
MQDSATWYVDDCPSIDTFGLILIASGSGESGKSTIVKQMKIIHQNGYTTEELQMYRMTIYKNILDCAKALIGAMNQLNIHTENAGNDQYCDYLNEYAVDPDPEKPLDPKVGQAIGSIWTDPCIPKLLEQSTRFYIMDSAP